MEYARFISRLRPAAVGDGVAAPVTPRLELDACAPARAAHMALTHALTAVCALCALKDMITELNYNLFFEPTALSSSTADSRNPLGKRTRRPIVTSLGRRARGKRGPSQDLRAELTPRDRAQIS